MSEYDVIAISNKTPTAWYYLYQEYFRSLGDYKPKVFQPEFWGGLGTKPKVLYQLIKGGTINTKYIIFTDCWDLIFTSTPDDIIETYKVFNSPIVISAEANCFPDDFKNEFDEANPNKKYRYLNSGFICGETEAILTCLEAMDLPNLPDDYFDPIQNKNIHPNDQYEWMKIFVKQVVPIELDTMQILSQTLHGEDIDNFDFSRERIMNKTTKVFPCTFHFNGGSKDNMQLREPILKHLNLL